MLTLNNRRLKMFVGWKAPEDSHPKVKEIIAKLNILAFLQENNEFSYMFFTYPSHDAFLHEELEYPID